MKESVDILITGGVVVTMDDERRIINDGAVAVRADRIVEVGKADALGAKYEPATTIAARRKVVMPGLIGPHVHLVEQFPRGFLNDIRWGGGVTTAQERLWPYKLAMGRDDVYYSALLANLEMIKSGLTCFNDPASHPEHVDAHFEATEQAGIRAAICRSCVTVSPSGYPLPDGMLDTPEDAIAKTLDMIDRWQGRGEGRLRPWLGARHIMSAREEYIRPLMKEHERLSAELPYRIGIHAHAAFSEGGLQNVIDRTGMREVEWLDSLGALGPQWLLAHAVRFDDDELEALVRNDVKIVHCPATSSQCGYGAGTLGRFMEMLEAGMTVSIAPDTAWCNNQLDMFFEMKHLAFMHKESKIDGSVLPAETALEMATLHGARAMLWEDEIGSLKPGMKADVIVVDQWRPNSIPLHDHNVVKNIVYATYGTQVDTVVCNGRIVMEDRVVKTLDEEEILERSQHLAADVVARHPAAPEPAWPVI